MTNHLIDIIDMREQSRKGDRAQKRLPPMGMLEEDFVADGIELNKGLNRMQTCLVAMAMKRRQLYWEEVDMWLYENKGDSCVYSPVIRTEVLKGRPTLSICWTRISYRKARTDLGMKGNRIYSTSVKASRGTRYARADFPKASDEVWKRIRSAEEDFSRIRTLFNRAKALRRNYYSLVGDFNAALADGEERMTEGVGVLMEVLPVSVDD